jgi:aspartyl-tRNA(Asn)/glutamyl-tRNA(Gln) amidotransferase subunit C
MAYPNPATLTNLADLALLDVASLSSEEQATLHQALLQTTAWVSELMEVQTDGVSATVQPFALPTSTRSDTAAPNVNSTDIVALAPDRLGDLFRVPRVTGAEVPDSSVEVRHVASRDRTQGHE